MAFWRSVIVERLCCTPFHPVRLIAATQCFLFICRKHITKQDGAFEVFQNTSRGVVPCFKSMEILLYVQIPFTKYGR